MHSCDDGQLMRQSGSYISNNLNNDFSNKNNQNEEVLASENERMKAKILLLENQLN